MAHLWHDVIIGPESPNIFNAVIEIPRYDKNKYELDKVTGTIRCDRVLDSSVIYPENYGFIPQTYAMDNDPLDVLVLGRFPIHPGTHLRARAIGVVKMKDGGVRDDKIIAVHVDDPSVAEYEDAHALKDYRIQEIQRFLDDYKKYEKKKVEVGDFGTAAEAKLIIQQSFDEYQKRVQNGKIIRP